MPEEGHFSRLRAIIAGVARRGLAAHVFTHRRFEAQVLRDGGRFADLFAGRPLEEGSGASMPFTSRFVTFAGRHAEGVLREAAALRPSLVVSDGFALVGRIVAERLGLPYVNVCAGHNVEAARFRTLLETDPRVRTSPECHLAVETLRERFGILDASPFSFVAGPSPFLNIYGEPEEYLAASERAAFEPIAFFGSLPPAGELDREGAGQFEAASLKVYASFGTVVWRYWAGEAIAALSAVADAVEAAAGACAIVSLGGTDLEPEAKRALTRRNVSVERYVDQWTVLRHADVFVTHHGLNSTHEAVFHRVPMISYPFFWDQPALARLVQSFGFAVPLTEAQRGPVTSKDVAVALARVLERRDAMRRRLEEGRAWELRTIGEREAILDRIVSLCH